jgi:CxxC motif-containing protein (DUF1111 family)
MGVTNTLRLQDTTTGGKTTSDPEDSSDDLGLDNIDHFAEFVRGTKVPPRDSLLLASADTQAGQVLFEKLGCAICHVTTLVTVRPGTVINAGTFTVPEALGNKIIHPYSDFLLHDLGHRASRTPGHSKQDAHRAPVGPAYQESFPARPQVLVLRKCH